MKTFDGFSARASFTPIPDLFFSGVLPEIDNLDEIKVTLHVFWAIYHKRGYPIFVSFRELLADAVLAKSLGGEGQPADRLQHGLERAVGRGTLLHLTLERDGEIDDLYFRNIEADRRTVARLVNGELEIGRVVRSGPEPVTQERTNIFILYEQNVGSLTSIIADELKEAEKLYPFSWIEDAFRIAVKLNKRRWSTIAHILERWAAEGKDNGELGRDSKTDASYKEYLRRYGHLLKR
ncbi:DnaD domain-containing protein [Chloroflexota bacterium]